MSNFFENHQKIKLEGSFGKILGWTGEPFAGVHGTISSNSPWKMISNRVSFAWITERIFGKGPENNRTNFWKKSWR